MSAMEWSTSHDQDDNYNVVESLRDGDNTIMCKLISVKLLKNAPQSRESGCIVYCGSSQTRQAFLPEQINEACYVDVKGNKVVCDSWRNNPNVNYDGKRFSYKVTSFIR
ncbi:hypothetical protein ACFE04_027022 [Oxalis oulophora]